MRKQAQGELCRCDPTSSGANVNVGILMGRMLMLLTCVTQIYTNSALKGPKLEPKGHHVP